MLVIPSHNFSIGIEETPSLKPACPDNAISTMHQTSPDLVPERFYDRSDTCNVMTSTHQIPIKPSTSSIEFNNFPINPFFPPMNPAAPSPNKRRRTDPLIDHAEGNGRYNTSTRHDIFAEIEALACMEVLTSR